MDAAEGDPGSPDEFHGPRLMGRGTSRETWTIPGTDWVQSWRFGSTNALDLRLVSDTAARRALAESYPRTDGILPGAEVAQPANLHRPIPRLERHATEPTSSEAEYDRYVGHLIDELAYVSHHSEAAANSLMPHARETVEALTRLFQADVPLRCAPDAGDSAVARAFTVRVAEVVSQVIGEDLVRQFRLPSPRRLEEELPAAFDDRSPLVLAHGDPTVGNLMWRSGEAILIDWELARPAPRLSAAAHTLAALVTRSAYPVRQERIEQFVENVAGARTAIDSGLYAAYYGYEVARAPWVDVLRGLRGEVEPSLVHRNVARHLGADAPSERRVRDLLSAQAGRDFRIPVLPLAVAGLVTTPQSIEAHPEAQTMAVAALHEEATDAAAEVLTPELYQQYRGVLDTLARAIGPMPDSVADIGKRLREEGKTELTAETLVDRMVYRFSRPGQSDAGGPRPEGGAAPGRGDGESKTVRRQLSKGD